MMMEITRIGSLLRAWSDWEDMALTPTSLPSNRKKWMKPFRLQKPKARTFTQARQAVRAMNLSRGFYLISPGLRGKSEGRGKSKGKGKGKSFTPRLSTPAVMAAARSMPSRESRSTQGALSVGVVSIFGGIVLKGPANPWGRTHNSNSQPPIPRFAPPRFPDPPRFPQPPLLPELQGAPPWLITSGSGATLGYFRSHSQAEKSVPCRSARNN